MDLRDPESCVVRQQADDNSRSDNEAAQARASKRGAEAPAHQAAVTHLHDASPPTAKEIRDYAEYLGLNPDVDEEFLWIAEEALCAPLPAGWSEHFRCADAFFALQSICEHGLLTT